MISRLAFLIFAFLLAGIRFGQAEAPSPAAGGQEAGEVPGSEELLSDEIVLSLGYGFGFPPESSLFSAGLAEGIRQGLILDDLVKSVLIQRALNERLLLEIDYHSARNRPGASEERNSYSLLYRGPEYELLRELSLGNKYLSIPGSRFMPIDEGNRDSFALRARAGAGGFGLDALFRYGVSLEGHRRFQGNRRLLEIDILDVDYAKGRFFLLPDTGIDEASLQVLKSTKGVSDRLIDGKGFSLLSRQADFTFDNSSGQLYLTGALAAGEELAVYYKKLGVEVGDGTLGLQAIIDASGTRRDFNAVSFPEYFDSTATYLYLKKSGLNSYWELRNAYYLQELSAGNIPDQISVTLAYTSNGGVNTNYEGLLEQLRIDPALGAIFFNFNDNAGFFYSRPFPGEYPFTHPTNQVNPFDPANPIYGGIGYPSEADSINTLRIRYTMSADSYFLDYDIIEGSVRVTVDGVPLSPSSFSVDYASGIISFQPGVIGPASQIDVIYSYTPLGGGRRELFAALGLGYANDWLQVRNLTTYSLPIEDPPAPRVGEERRSALANSTDLSLSIGAKEGKKGYMAELTAGGALSLSNANSQGKAIIADMEDDRRYAVSLLEAEWLLASRSQLLPALLPSPVPLITREALLYENFWESRLLGGDVLRDISWDNSANPSFSYSQKAGPYNSADKTAGGQDRSLVIDFAFPAGTSEGYVSVVTGLAPANLTDYQRFYVILRGAGISGDGVRVYVEALSSYQEDLNGNDTLDGESSSAEEGFSITPLDGQPTAIGSDRDGQANGRLDSEDLDGSGYLDPLGPFVSDLEEGAVLALSGGPAYVASLTVGEEQWRHISLDIRDLIQINATVFQQVKALRITVKPVSSPTPAAVSGKILVNGIWFSSSGMTNDTPDSLSLREVSVSEDPQVKAHAFSASFPEIYEDLHGQTSYREKNAHEEKVLVCSFAPTLPLPMGSTASLARRFGYPVDLSVYREYRMYLYLPAGQSIPSEAVLRLDLLASSQEGLGADIPPGAISTGWNEILVGLEEPYSVTVKGAKVGELSQTGSLSVLRSVTEIRFGIRAQTADLGTPFEFWLDEWHLSESRYYLDTAFYAEGTVGYRGSLASVGSFSLLADTYLSGGYERKEGSFLDELGRRRESYFAGLESNFLSYLFAKVQLRGSTENPVSPAAESSLAFGGGFEEGKRTWSYLHRLGLETGSRYLPVLEHSFQRSNEVTDDAALTKADYVLSRSETTGESLSLGVRYGFPEVLSQSYSFTRRWTYERERAASAGSGTVVDSSASQSLSQLYDGRLSLVWDSSELALSLLRDETLITDEPSVPPDLFASYAQKLSTLFQPAAIALPGSSLNARADKGRISVSIPRRRYWGTNLSLESSFNELNFDQAAGNRDTMFSHALVFSLPVSPDGQGELVLTPRMSRTFSGNYRKMESSLEEARLLMEAYKQLFQPPFSYLNPWLELGRLHEYQAVDLFAGSPLILGSSTSTLRTSLSLDGHFETVPWYLPSLGSAAVKIETSRQGETYGQKRSVRFGIGKELPLGAKIAKEEKDGDRLYVDAGLEKTWDYANKVLGYSLEERSTLRLFHGVRGELKADHTLSYTRERQRIGDERLYLFPSQPGRERPVAVRPDSDTIRSLLNLQYLWEQPVRPRPGPRIYLIPASAGAQSIVHQEQLEIENHILIADRKKTTATRTIPLRIILEHDTQLAVSDSLSFELALKTVGGVEERIELGASSYWPSLGIELRLSARLTF